MGNLADEIKDLLDQLGDGGRSIHELDKQRRRMESEKEELQSALEEAEGSLEAEENKVLRAQLELGQVRQEIDRKIVEKEEEFNNTRKNHARAMESMQASLETEQKAKAEGLRIKKKLEGDINEFEIALDHANKANNEALKSIKRYQGQLREAEVHYEEAARLRQEMSEKASLAERRSNALQGEMEEARALLDSAERGKRQTEAELTEARMAVNEMNNVNSRAAADKRRLEGAVHTLQAEIDDMLHQAKASEEKAKKAMVDAARLADELRAEQDHVSVQSKAKRSLETTMADMENRLTDANESAMKGGKAAMAKLESRIRELEIELGSVQARTADNMKGHQKAERKIKELAFQNDEDKKNQVASLGFIYVCDTNRVIVSDSNNHRLQIFDVNGKVLTTFGSEGTEEGQFKFPRGVAVDEQGFIFVADSGNNRIQIFNPDGTFLRAFGRWGQNDGEFKGLEGIAVNSKGNILVADRENHRIQIF